MISWRPLAAYGLIAVCCQFPLAQAQTIRFDQDNGAFLLEGWPGATTRPADASSDLFIVSVDTPDVPPLLGRYSVANGVVKFAPQYPVQPGVRYRAVAPIPGAAPITAIVEIPKANVAATTVVSQIYPSPEVVPENLLKFYIHFSASMSQGDAFDHVSLLDEKGAVVEDAFLGRGGELWDRPQQRFTLFFDPGRVKRDLEPNLLLGTALTAGRRYTLVIARTWLDANGNPLKEAFRKSFRAGPPDRQQVDLEAWKVVPPAAGSIEPITVEFPEPMDHALAERELDVFDSAGRVVSGRVVVERGETRWQLYPESPWRAGAYVLRTGADITDLAGNKVGRAFEIDRFEQVDERLVQQMHDISFSIN